MSAVIVWFRRDLRLADHAAWAAAAATGLPIVAVYVHAPDEEGDWADGAASRWWLHHSLAALDARLRERGGRLVLRCGPSADALIALAQETGARAVHWQRRYEPASVSRDVVVKQRLREHGLIAESHAGSLCVEPWQVQTQSGQPYRVFTPFWRAIQSRLAESLPQPEPAGLAMAATPVASVALPELGLLPRVAWDDGLRGTWTPGEAGALRQMQRFADRIAIYGVERDRPDRAATSELSPHLHFGEITPRQILAVVARTIGLDAPAAEPFLRELGWREFAHHLLFHVPDSAIHDFQPKFAAFAWATPDRHLLRAWQRGRTGIPLVDAGMRQLWETGWMHNRVRMVVASFLTKNLRYHWLHGARWFWDTLVDADLAANTLGWQWTAGTGADAAPYFRVFNPVAQGERFDPLGVYVRRFVPELAAVPDAAIHRPWTLRAVDQAAFGVSGVYARPLVDLAASRAAALAAHAALSRASAR